LSRVRRVNGVAHPCAAAAQKGSPSGGSKRRAPTREPPPACRALPRRGAGEEAERVGAIKRSAATNGHLEGAAPAAGSECVRFNFAAHSAPSKSLSGSRRTRPLTRRNGGCLPCASSERPNHPPPQQLQRRLLSLLAPKAHLPSLDFPPPTPHAEGALGWCRRINDFLTPADTTRQAPAPTSRLLELDAPEPVDSIAHSVATLLLRDAPPHGAIGPMRLGSFNRACFRMWRHLRSLGYRLSSLRLHLVFCLNIFKE
jgi:hypothetical protein